MFLSEDDRVKLGDFGISKVLERVGDFANTPLGTPYYLSPEICSGFKYDYKSDLWMLGCILYELCALKRPFEGESLHTVISSIMTQPFLPLPKDTKPVFCAAVAMTLEKNPNFRATIDDVIALPEVAAKIAEILEDPVYELHRREVLPPAPEAPDIGDLRFTVLESASAPPALSPVPRHASQRSKTPISDKAPSSGLRPKKSSDPLEAEEPVRVQRAELQRNPPNPFTMEEEKKGGPPESGMLR